MSLVSEFTDFPEALRRRRERVEHSAPPLLRAVRRELGDLGVTPLLHISQLLHDTVHDLAAAEGELRAQSDELFRTRVDLDAREARFRQLFELAPVAYLTTTREAHVCEVNAVACTLLARPANGLVGAPLAWFVDAEERPAFRTALQRVNGSRRVEEWPIRLVPAGGSPVECRMRVRVVPSAGGGPEPSLAWCITEESGSIPGEW